MEERKACCTCKRVKPLICFHNSKSHKSGKASRCKECQSSYQKVWRVPHRERLRLYSLEYFANNKDKFRENRKRQYERTKAEAKRLALKWAKENKGRSAESKKRYKTKKMFSTPRWAQIERMKAVYQKAREWGMEVDHIVPLQSPYVCGLHVWENLQLLHRSLNAQKGNKEWPDMAER